MEHITTVRIAHLEGNVLNIVLSLAMLLGQFVYPATPTQDVSTTNTVTSDSNGGPLPTCNPSSGNCPK